MTLESNLEQIADAQTAASNYLLRIAVALETLAVATQTVGVVEPIETTKPPRKARTVAAAPAASEPSVSAPAALVVASGFLDDDDAAMAIVAPTVAETLAAQAAVPGNSEAEQRQYIRAKLIALQKALDPERALKVLKEAGGSETLISLKPEKFGTVLNAIANAMPKGK